MPQPSTTDPRVRIRRHPERAVPDQSAAILAGGQVAHIGFCVQGVPYVLPFTYHYDAAEPDRLYVHGAPASRALRQLAGGGPVCVTVTLLDALVYSRSAKYHSVNYRSVVALGRAREIADPVEKAAVLARTILRYFRGREAGTHYAPPSAAELRATRLIEIRLEAWSAKVREGGPLGPLDADPDAPGTAGVIAPTPPAGRLMETA
jgi:nitroimidazol reductase NimA-like FMN-containing flavoprotein (pyridoxamine 5'-phosphate oxidase superfamily)